MSSSSQSIIEAVFNNSTQFTLHSPKTDPQRYFEFTNLNEQTPSFNRDKLKESNNSKLQIHQNYQAPIEQMNQSKGQPQGNQTYFSQINLYSKNENNKFDQGYIVQVSKNCRLDLIQDGDKKPSSSKSNEINTNGQQQKEQNLKIKQSQNRIPQRSLHIDIPQIEVQQKLDSQDLKKKLESNFNQKSQSARTSPLRIQQSQYVNVFQKQQEKQSLKESQIEKQYNLTDRILRASKTTKSFTQQKLDSLRSSQQRKYFQKQDLKQQNQQLIRQQISQISKDNKRGRSLEDKENQNQLMSQQSSLTKLKQKVQNVNPQNSQTKGQLKPTMQAINCNYIISQYFEQRVNKVVNQFNYKFK